MFVSAPASLAMIDWLGWQLAVTLIALSFVAILPVLPLIARVAKPTAGGDTAAQMSRAVGMAFQDRSYTLLFVGFYVCGFHVAFIQTHLPAYITDLGLAATVGGMSIALIGLFNIAGSFLSGWSGQRHSKKSVLAGIYLARAAVITVFLLTPISAMSVYVFSAIMGLLWLSTVPLTTGLVAQTQGLRYLSTLVGLVFLSHQIGSFTGAWLGGRLYDIQGDYSLMWWAAVAFGVLAAALHWPIRETPGPLAQRTA